MQDDYCLAYDMTSSDDIQRFSADRSAVAGNKATMKRRKNQQKKGRRNKGRVDGRNEGNKVFSRQRMDGRKKGSKTGTREDWRVGRKKGRDQRQVFKQLSVSNMLPPGCNAAFNITGLMLGRHSHQTSDSEYATQQIQSIHLQRE